MNFILCLEIIKFIVMDYCFISRRKLIFISLSLPIVFFASCKIDDDIISPDNEDNRNQKELIHKPEYAMFMNWELFFQRYRCL